MAACHQWKRHVDAVPAHPCRRVDGRSARNDQGSARAPEERPLGRGRRLRAFRTPCERARWLANARVNVATGHTCPLARGCRRARRANDHLGAARWSCIGEIPLERRSPDYRIYHGSEAFATGWRTETALLRIFLHHAVKAAYYVRPLGQLGSRFSRAKE